MVTGWKLDQVEVPQIFLPGTSGFRTVHFPVRSLLAFEEAFQNSVSSPWCFCLYQPIIVVTFFSSGISALRNFSLFQSHGFRYVLQAGDDFQILLSINYCQRQSLFSASCWMKSVAETNQLCFFQSLLDSGQHLLTHISLVSSSSLQK